MQFQSGSEDLLEEEMATHSGIYAWRIPWTEERGGLQSCKGSDTAERLSTAPCSSQQPQWETETSGQI